uniref:Zf-LYAR domain-containing protein n=2 Tax=Wuchereria bancrofti TaxID=6293 RepID=A0A1I8EXU9_WUCBA
MQFIDELNGYQMVLVGEEELLSFSFRWFVFITAGLPLTALFLCISLALALHLDESTRTHCGVVNYLPSISAAVASFSPERYIWRFFIALHSAPRIVAALAYKNLLLTSPLRPLNDRTWFELSCQIACFLNIAETLFLLLLTTASSVENYVVHKVSFLGFALCSTMYMLVATSLFQYSGRRRTSSLGEKSFQYKVLMCSISILSLLLAVYFFERHNTYCEPGIYTLFAIAEYIVVLTNIFFHCTLLFDFHGKYFILTSSGPNFHYQPLLPEFNANKRSVMVFFSCDRCSEALKKNQVDKHGFKCRDATYSCLDCGQAFSIGTYKNHIKCVTENKKYGGKNYVEKENKGEAKQNRWIEQVERAIENVTDKGLKDLLQQIHGFNNIPRKEAKFINFLQNSIKIRNRDLCIKAWNCISEQAEKIQQAATEKVELRRNGEGNDNLNDDKGLNCKQGASKNNGEKVEEIETGKEELKKNGVYEDHNNNVKQGTLITDDVKKFKWKRAIKRALKEADNGQMKVKRLKTKVIQSYLASGQSNRSDENPETIFNAKLCSLGLRIDNKIVRLN